MIQALILGAKINKSCQNSWMKAHIGDQPEDLEGNSEEEDYNLLMYYVNKFINDKHFDPIQYFSPNKSSKNILVGKSRRF